MENNVFEKGRSAPAVGTALAVQQLQEHCNRLNAMNGDKYWFVAKMKDGKSAVDCKPKGSA